jgi:hypothetical protein
MAGQRNWIGPAFVVTLGAYLGFLLWFGVIA